ncbi:conserved hypothetical protein [Ricinus communis]|uniref:Uncharacterized protein n=1 Tax=Ricinus communis TaxID=3988 RepID=B9SU21_RICCO|nr:conserved hypothetical protein [Ricinus communis]
MSPSQIRIADDGIEEEKEDAESHEIMMEEAGQEGDQGDAASNDDKTDVHNLLATCYNQIKAAASVIKEEEEEAENNENKEEEAGKDENDQIKGAAIVIEEEEEAKNDEDMEEEAGQDENMGEGNQGAANANDKAGQNKNKGEGNQGATNANDKAGQEENEGDGDQGVDDANDGDDKEDDDRDNYYDFYYDDDDIDESVDENHRVEVWFHAADEEICLDTIDLMEGWESVADLETEAKLMAVAHMEEELDLPSISVSDVNMRVMYYTGTHGYFLDWQLIENPEAMQWAEFSAIVTIVKVTPQLI